MPSRVQQAYLALITQSFNAGGYNFLSPIKMQAIGSLIAGAWKALREGHRIDAHLDEIRQILASSK